MNTIRTLHITITGFNHYYGLRPFAIGNLVQCRKEPGNLHDDEAILCRLPYIGTVGYVANSPHTTAGGTMSAGRIYDLVPDQFFVRVLFTTQSMVICQVEGETDNGLEAEFARQGETEPCSDAP